MSREASPVRDHGRRRERDDDSYGNRDSKRPRRGSHTMSDEVRFDSFDKPLMSSFLNGQTSRPPTSDSKQRDDDPERIAEAKRQQERLAKLEAWKKRKAEATQLNTASSSAGPNSPATPNPATSTDPADPDENRPPSPGRAPFDPKAIKKRVEQKMKGFKTTLGSDIAIPATTNPDGASTGAPSVPAPRANGSVKPTDAKITGFDLNKATGLQAADTSSKLANGLDEEDQVQRKFTKHLDLSQVPMTSDTAPSNYDETQDDGADDVHSDEGEAEAAREAALKRAEEAQAENQDVEMAEAPEEPSAEASAEAATGGMDVEENLDPLDAFMKTLPAANMPARRPTKRQNQGPQIFDEDDGPDLDAVGENPEDILNNAKKKRKELPDTDHSKIDYEEVRKNFYSESIEVAEMTKEEVDALRYDLGDIKVNGINAPRPITKWSQCAFGQQILDVIREQKFEGPTAIQCQALPAIMSGRDTIGIAKTGSGKTLAFILPMFRHIKDQRPIGKMEGPIGLIMAPTRELAVQIHRECKPYLKALNLRGVCAYGGAPIKEQIAELKRGAEVVVCTPGRLIDLLVANSGHVTNLRRVTYVVMDEADRMFDMGFEPQITRILNTIRPDRQTVTFSATFPPKMEKLAKKALQKPVQILVGSRSVVAAEITQLIEVRPEDTKFNRVLQLIGDLYEKDEDARTLIFVERQEMADDIFKQLSKRGYPCLSVHGGREQIDRDQAIMDFKSGAIPIMVATSVAARGLDVKQLKLVINYDSPNHGEDYVHRAGRTGRAGNTGTAVTFVTPEQERFAPFLVRALEDSKQEVPEDLRAMAESHKEKVASGQAQKVGSGFGGRGIERMDAARAAERAWEKGQFKTGDEPEEDENEKEQKAGQKASVGELVAKATGAIKGSNAPAEQPAEPAPASEQPVMDTKLQKLLSDAMVVQKAEKPKPISNDDPMAKAAAAAATISSRIGSGKGKQTLARSCMMTLTTAAGPTRPGAPVDNRGPDAGAFHATLEINDFPQQARWAVTNRGNVAKILEATGTSITTKGTYYPAGKEPQPGELPKLYVLVEGDTEVAVSAAMKGLTGHLTEGIIKAQDQEARGGGGGRYKVV